MVHDEYNKGYLETIFFKLAGILVDVAQKELFCCAQAVNPSLVHFKCNLCELNCFRVYVGIPAFDFAMTARDPKNLVHILSLELEDLAVCQHYLSPIDMWMEVEAHHYSPIMDAILMEIRIRPIFGQRVDERAVEDNIEKLNKVLEVYEARLSSSRYLAGDFISLADLNHVSTMLCLGITTYGSVLDAYPRVRAWWDDLRARPAVRKVSDLMNPSVKNDLK